MAAYRKITSNPDKSSPLRHVTDESLPPANRDCFDGQIIAEYRQINSFLKYLLLSDNSLTQTCQLLNSI